MNDQNKGGVTEGCAGFQGKPVAECGPCAGQGCDGELPPLPETHYNGCGDGSEPLYTPEMMHDYARAALAQRAGSAKPAATAPEPVAYLDEKGIPHRAPRERIFGLWNHSCGSGNVLWSGMYFTDAVDAWKSLHGKGEEADLTVLNGGIYARHSDMVWRYAELKGGFNCPMCGESTPHVHNAVDIQTHRDNEAYHQKKMMEKWVGIDTSIAALEKRHQLREPLYTAPPAAVQSTQELRNALTELATAQQKLIDANAEITALNLAASAKQSDSERFFMDHGMWHDRVTGQHMWNQDQYDEAYRDGLAIGRENAELADHAGMASRPTPSSVVKRKDSERDAALTDSAILEMAKGINFTTQEERHFYEDSYMATVNDNHQIVKFARRVMAAQQGEKNVGHSQT